MCGSFIINAMPLSLASVRLRVERFLASNGLRMDAMDTYVAICRHEDSDEIIAGGGLQADVIKCVAVSEEARSEGLTNKLVSHLLSIAMERGFDSVKLFTKPSNLKIFKGLGFELLAETQDAILMENGVAGLRDYTKYLQSLRREGRNGVIVMNANPFTKGHRYLVERASSQVDNLYVIVVREDLSRFSYAERKSMIESGCGDLHNVTVCEGSGYVISQSTFPTYFLKSLENASFTQMSLDINLFTTHIAPALGATVRFAGSEPGDALTRSYNALMAEMLPKSALNFIELARLENEGVPVSASLVRRYMDESRFAEAVAMVHPSSIPYLISYSACESLRIELDTTPKPGLVDKNDNGAHTDMDYDKMLRSIAALRPYFTKIAVEACGGLDIESIQRRGLEAEASMLEATNGVNTHKGALFCLGLSVAVVSFLASKEGRVEEKAFRQKLSRLAEDMTPAESTHGAEAVKKYRVTGALANARMAYPALFEDWLPYYNRLSEDEFRSHKTLLRIMAALDDTNVLHRGGEAGLAQVKADAKALLEGFSPDNLAKLNETYIRNNISPGGSADMLSLTIFLSHIVLTTNYF